MCDPKIVGGLNITSLKEWNQTTIGKLLWNIHSKKDKLWIRWVNVYYLKGHDVLSWEIPSTCFWMIRKIVKSRDIMVNIDYWSNITKGDKFCTTTMYRELRGNKVPVEWGKMLIDNHVCPKAKFTLRLLLNGRPPTKY